MRIERSPKDSMMKMMKMLQQNMKGLRLNV